MLIAENGVIAYLRKLQGGANDINQSTDTETPVIMILNAGFSSVKLDLPTGEHLPENSQWRDLLGNAEAQVTGNMLHNLIIPSRAGIILSLNNP